MHDPDFDFDNEPTGEWYPATWEDITKVTDVTWIQDQKIPVQDRDGYVPAG